MRSTLFLAVLPVVLGCANPDTNSCASVMTASSAVVATYCATYTQSANTVSTGLPAWATAGCGSNPKHISSACSCLVPATLATAVKASSTIAPVVLTPVTVTSSVVKVSPTSVKTTATPVKLAATSAKSSATSIKPTTSAKATVAAPATTAAAVIDANACIVTAAGGVASAVSSCTDIVLSAITFAASVSLDLTDLKDGTTVTFAGKTSFDKTEDSDFDPIIITGTNVVITGTADHVIDGNGALYWDGEGSNGGSDKPDHFIVAKHMTDSSITNLNIQNWPVHCFSITNGNGLVIDGITLDNSAGDASNDLSDGKAAAHNSDGFDFSSTDNSILSNSVVKNQDDCVAITSGTNVTVTGMTCSGGHGLSIGSVGGKSNNVVSGITFSDSTISDSSNGCRIKSNSGTTGTIEDIVYSNIVLSNISDYGIDVQQDYLNGGPTGEPTDGVTISGVTFTDITGTATGTNYYVLCGDSCSDFTFSGVDITGGEETSSCNFPSSGCPA